MAQFVHDLCKVMSQADLIVKESNPAFSLGGLQGNLFVLVLFGAMWQEKILFKQYTSDIFCYRDLALAWIVSVRDI